MRIEAGRPRLGYDMDARHDPAGGRHQRARRELHQGLLRRPGDGRAAPLQGQAEPPPARPAASRAGRARRPRSARRPEVGRLGSTCVSPTLGPIALALVRREAEPGATVDVGGAPGRGRRASLRSVAEPRRPTEPPRALAATARCSGTARGRRGLRPPDGRARPAGAAGRATEPVDLRELRELVPGRRAGPRARRLGPLAARLRPRRAAARLLLPLLVPGRARGRRERARPRAARCSSRTTPARCRRTRR